ncbi:MAG: SirB1 family protein [Alphaproteobacteria bacterium]
MNRLKPFVDLRNPVAKSATEARVFLAESGLQKDNEIDVVQAALAFALLDAPHADIVKYAAHLNLLARECADAAQRIDPAIAGTKLIHARIGAINQILFDEHGYEGDRANYDDLRNANLFHVIDRRKGLPIALAILYLHMARSQGWACSGTNFPGHFLCWIGGKGEEWAFVDPFHRGRICSEMELDRRIKSAFGADAKLNAGHLAPASAREVLLRLQNNIKSRLIDAQNDEAALDVLRRMLLIAPNQLGLIDEAAGCCQRLGQLNLALDFYARAAELATDRATRERFLAAARGATARLN